MTIDIGIGIGLTVLPGAEGEVTPLLFLLGDFGEQLLSEEGDFLLSEDTP
jgi:hypothetical protein